MTDTLTTTRPAYLVRYAAYQDDARPYEWNGQTNDNGDDGMTFYAVDSTYSGMLCLIVPESDPRHAGMWRGPATNSGEFRLAPEWLFTEGTIYRGWNVSKSSLTVLETFTDPAATPAVDVPEFVDTTFADIPVGTVWSNRIPDARKNEDYWNDSLKWVKVNDTHYCTLGYVGASSAPVTRPISDLSYSVTIRNSGAGVLPSGKSYDDYRQRIADLEAAARRKDAEFEAWKARASEIAVRYANDNDLCGEFDRCMEEIGLECDRSTEYSVTVTHSFTVNVPRGENVRDYVLESGGPEEFDPFPNWDYNEA